MIAVTKLENIGYVGRRSSARAHTAVTHIHDTPNAADSRQSVSAVAHTRTSKPKLDFLTSRYNRPTQRNKQAPTAQTPRASTSSLELHAHTSHRRAAQHQQANAAAQHAGGHIRSSHTVGRPWSNARLTLASCRVRSPPPSGAALRAGRHARVASYSVLITQV